MGIVWDFHCNGSFHRLPFLSFWFFPLPGQRIPFQDRPGSPMVGRPGPQDVVCFAGFCLLARRRGFCRFSNGRRNRYDSFPVSMMWARSVIRSSNALHSRTLGKHLGPFREGQIRCQDHRGPLGPVRDDLEEQFGAHVRHRDVADCVNGDQFVSEPTGPELGGTGCCAGLR